MRRLIIEIPEPGDLQKTFDVVDEAGRRCDGLCFGEMIEQVSMLSISGIPAERIGKGYAMQTADEWEQCRDERSARRFCVVDGGRAE